MDPTGRAPARRASDPLDGRRDAELSQLALVDLPGPRAVSPRALGRRWCWPASTASEASRAQPSAAEGRLEFVEKIFTAVALMSMQSQAAWVMTSVRCLR